MAQMINLLKFTILSCLVSFFIFINQAMADNKTYQINVTVHVKNTSSTQGLTYNLQHKETNHFFTEKKSITYKTQSNTFTLMASKNGSTDPTPSNMLKHKENYCLRDFSYSVDNIYRATIKFYPNSREFCKKFKIDMMPKDNLFMRKCNLINKGATVSCDITIYATIKNS